MFTCVIEYSLNLDKLDAFKDYARAWVMLIEKYGGRHHGYFLPPSGDEKTQIPSTAFSFPEMGSVGVNDKAFAFFSFDSVEQYESYKKAVKDDEDCISATKELNTTQSFVSYKRSFKIAL